MRHRGSLRAAVTVLCVLCVLCPAAHGLGTDIKLELGEYFFNPSVVEHNGIYMATARTAHMKRVHATTWWFNQAYICASTRIDFREVTCLRFDPWNDDFNECLWGSPARKADVDTKGIEDPKLFVWPGAGVYAIFGRKPQRVGGEAHCPMPVIFKQFLVQVTPENNTKPDAWDLKTPVALEASIFPHLYHQRSNVKEKNWMPFVYKNELYMTHNVNPHRVFRINRQGQAVAKYLSSDHTLFAGLKNQRLHGGPPLVYVPTELYSSLTDTDGGYRQGGYYLGIMHYFEMVGPKKQVKHYRHHAYKMEAQPPFRICAISKEVPLVFRKATGSGGGAWTHDRIWKDTSLTGYISGLFINSDSQIIMSYGSSDIDARMLVLTVEELESLFDKPYTCASGSNN